MSIIFKNDEDFPQIEIIQSDWKETKEVDFLYASRLVRDARDLWNLTFKKTEKDFK